MRLAAEQQQALEQQGIPALPRKGRAQISRTDPDSRFLRTARGWELGYTAELAVSDDHLIVATRVTQNATDNGSLVPMVDEVEQRCGERPEKVTGDAGFFSGLDGTGSCFDVLAFTAGEGRDAGAADLAGDLPDGVGVTLACDGKTGLDDVDAEGGKLVSHAQLLFVVHGAAGGLLAVA